MYKTLPVIAAVTCLLCSIYLVGVREYLGASVLLLYAIRIPWGDAIGEWLYRRFYARKDKSA